MQTAPSENAPDPTVTFTVEFIVFDTTQPPADVDPEWEAAFDRLKCAIISHGVHRFEIRVRERNSFDRTLSDELRERWRHAFDMVLRRLGGVGVVV